MFNPDSSVNLITQRSSWRSYSRRPLSEQIFGKIEVCLENLPSAPFGNQAEFRLVHKIQAAEQKVRFGTYGFIKGAQYFIVGKIKVTEHASEDYGYLLEYIILQLTRLDLGTCWLGGTFQRGEFARLIGLQSDELIPAITPVGIKSGKRSVRDRIIRTGAGSANRKRWEELFFQDSSLTPLAKEDAGRYVEVLEMVRQGPSASNKQPWRILFENYRWHLFLARSTGYRRMNLAVDMQKLDLGIAMYHFEAVARERQLQGEWQFQPEIAPQIPKWEYICSWFGKIESVEQ
jgi:nitroreductase